VLIFSSQLFETDWRIQNSVHQHRLQNSNLVRYGEAGLWYQAKGLYPLPNKLKKKLMIFTTLCKHHATEGCPISFPNNSKSRTMDADTPEI
jgi:hypothetical protein